MRAGGGAADRLVDYVTRRDPRTCSDRLVVQVARLASVADLGALRPILEPRVAAGDHHAVIALALLRRLSITPFHLDGTHLLDEAESMPADDLYGCARELFAAAGVPHRDTAALDPAALRSAVPEPAARATVVVRFAAFSDPVDAVRRLRMDLPMSALARFAERGGAGAAYARREALRRLQEAAGRQLQPGESPEAGAAELAELIRSDTPAGRELRDRVMSAVVDDDAGAIIPEPIVLAVLDSAISAWRSGRYGVRTMSSGPVHDGDALLDEPAAAAAGPPDVWGCRPSLIGTVRPLPTGFAVILARSVMGPDPLPLSPDVVRAVAELCPVEPDPFLVAWDRADEATRRQLAKAVFRRRAEPLPAAVLEHLTGLLRPAPPPPAQKADDGLLHAFPSTDRRRWESDRDPWTLSPIEEHERFVDRVVAELRWLWRDRGIWPRDAVSAWLLRDPSRLRDVCDIFDNGPMWAQQRELPWLTGLPRLFAAGGVTAPADLATRVALRRTVVAARLGIRTAGNANGPHRPAWADDD
jgi:hypothetical protein